MDSKSFELSLREQIDAKYDRTPPPNNPFVKLLAGEMTRAEAHETFGGMLGSLMNFNQVLLTRLLRTAPDVENRVELMDVIAQEFGVTGPRDAHPTFFVEFLESLGLKVDQQVMEEAVQSPAVRAEAEYLRSLSYCEALARILVGESLGPKVFMLVAHALRRTFNLPSRATLYFTHHAQHDKKDAEILFRMIAREAKTEDDRRRVRKIIDESYDFGRYAQYGCALSPEIDYSFAALFHKQSHRMRAAAVVELEDG